MQERELQLERVTELVEQQLRHSTQLTKLQQQVAALKADNAALSSQAERLQQVEGRLAEQEDKLAAANARAGKWKERAFALSQQLVSAASPSRSVQVGGGPLLLALF